MYARLGFGAWGILAEHDVADRFASLTVSAKVQRDMLTGRQSPSVAFLAALKTVH